MPLPVDENTALGGCAGNGELIWRMVCTGNEYWTVTLKITLLKKGKLCKNAPPPPPRKVKKIALKNLSRVRLEFSIKSFTPLTAISILQ